MEVLAEVVRRSCTEAAANPALRGFDTGDAELGLNGDDGLDGAALDNDADEEVVLGERELLLCESVSVQSWNPFDMRKLALHVHAPCEETLCTALALLSTASLHCQPDPQRNVPTYLGLALAQLFEGREFLVQDRIDPLDADDVHASFPSVFDARYSRSPCRGRNLSARSCMIFPDLPCIARIPCSVSYLTMFHGISSATLLYLWHCKGDAVIRRLYSLGVRVTVKAYDCRRQQSLLLTLSTITFPDFRDFRALTIQAWDCEGDKVLYERDWLWNLPPAGTVWIFETQAEHDDDMSPEAPPRVVRMQLFEQAGDTRSLLMERTEDSFTVFTTRDDAMSISAAIMGCSDVSPSSNVAQFYHDAFLATKPVLPVAANSSCYFMTVQLDRPATCRIYLCALIRKW